MSLPEWWANRDSRQRLNKNRDCQYWQPLFLFSEPDSSPTIRSIALGTTSYPAGPARIPASGIIGPGSSGILASAKTFMPLWAPHSSSYNAWGVKQYVVSLYRIVQSVPRTRARGTGGGAECAGTGFHPRPTFRECRHGNGLSIWLLSLLQ